jgi:Holliday junction resolvasome RuvABC endonuclease subunit
VIALGIDAATKTGWAKVERGNGRERLLEWGVLDFKKYARDPWNPAAFLALHCRAPEPVPNVVAIELPWMQKNAHVLLVLARICGRFEQAMGPSGAEIRVMCASEWQSKMLGATRMKRTMLKKLAVAWCRSNFKVDLPEDAADAAVMAVFALRFPD